MAMDKHDEEVSNLNYTYPCVVLCLNCEAILGDSFSVVSDFSERNLLGLSGVTKNVLVKDDLELSKDTFDEGCTYRQLLCRKCSTIIGKTYASTKASLDSMRNLFIFDMDNLVSYQLGDPDKKINCDLNVISVHYISLQLDKFYTILKHLDFRLKKIEQSMSIGNFKNDKEEKIDYLNLSDLYLEACSQVKKHSSGEPAGQAVSKNGLGPLDSESCDQEIPSTLKSDYKHRMRISLKADHDLNSETLKKDFIISDGCNEESEITESSSLESEDSPDVFAKRPSKTKNGFDFNLKTSKEYSYYDSSQKSLPRRSRRRPKQRKGD